MLKLFLWLRYLRKKKIVLLSIAAVALSCSLLIVVTSLFNSFIDAFEQSAVETMGDVVLTPPVKFANYPMLIEHLEKLGAVKAATATLSVPGLVHLGKGNVRAVIIWGIEPDRREKVTGFKRFLLKQKNSGAAPSFGIESSPDKLGGFVGVGVVAEPDEKTDEYNLGEIEKMMGKQVVLTTGAVTESGDDEEYSRQFKRKILPFTISDILFTGMYYVDENFVYLPIEQLQKILYPNEKDGIADQIQIKLTDNTKTDAAMAQIRGVWEAFAAEQLGWDSYLISRADISTSRQMQSQYAAELRKQMGVLLFIFGVISLTVVVLVFCIFYMIVETRQKDIAVIRSCGAGGGTVALVFMGFGGCIGIIGSALGAALGYVVTKNINTIEEWIRVIFGLKLWKSSVYMFSRIPNEVDWACALPIAFFAIIAAVAGALIPAIVAAKTRPVNILRYE
ncbi:MAG: FtsX-like permease family protein [Sedimentisphaerales bacterium]|nr:FtsX-like permease family protein [Sedimentisphaerales bacterium]